MGMQYLVKAMMVSASNVVLGAFAGMLMHVGYGMMTGIEAQIPGLLLFFGMIVVCFVYCFLLKKFVMGAELSITIPAICLALGVWIGWQFNVYA